MKLALIGDSHAEVVFPLLIPLLQKAGHTVVYQRAERGWSEASYNKVATLSSDLRQAGAQGAVVTLGGNNQALTAPAYQEAALRLLGALRAGGINTVWWVGPYTAISDTASARTRHEATANLQAAFLPRLSGVSWLDGRPFSTSGHQKDGVHFTREAYSGFAREIARWIDQKPAGFPVVASGVALVLVVGALLWRVR